MISISSSHIKKIYKPRDPSSHKGTHGHALLMAGNTGKMGAAFIAAKACLRSGPGLLTLVVPKPERVILQTALPEAMLQFKLPNAKELKSYAAIGIGPGLGTDAYCENFLSELLRQKDLPLVIDADALNVLAHNEKLLNSVPAQTILTPHVKEFDRLFGKHTDTSERQATAERTAADKSIIIVLKDAETLITDGRNSYINKNKNAGLAKGGSGDALLGIILALRCQGYTALDAAVLGVHLHSSAASVCNDFESSESMLITDVINCIGAAFKKIK